MIEDGSARLDRREKRLELLEETIVEHARVGRGFVHVVFEDVPPGENQIVEARERNEFFHLGRAAVGALAEANRSHLGERSDGLGEAFANGFDAGHECSGHRAHARDHHSELALGGLHGAVAGLGTRLFTATGSGGELHFTAGSFGMGKSGFTMLVLAGCGRIGELLSMTAAVGIPPVGHEYSRAFLIHESSFWWRWLATATNWT